MGNDEVEAAQMGLAMHEWIRCRDQTPLQRENVCLLVVCVRVFLPGHFSFSTLQPNQSGLESGHGWLGLPIHDFIIFLYYLPADRFFVFFIPFFFPSFVRFKTVPSLVFLLFGYVRGVKLRRQVEYLVSPMRIIYHLDRVDGKKHLIRKVKSHCIAPAPPWPFFSHNS